MSCGTPDAIIHQGAVAPYAVTYAVTSEGAPFDLSTATSALFRVYRENGSEDSWVASLSALTSTTATLTHPLVVGDVPDVELLRLTPEIVTPTGSFFGNTRTLKVVPKSEL